MAVWLGLGLGPLGRGAEAQELIIEKPAASADRFVELNLHLASYYGYGYVGFSDFPGG